jgi:outer membrane protein insertion porin family
MPSTSPFQGTPRVILSALLFLLFSLSLVCSQQVLAMQQNTVFLPLRINAADQKNLQQLADETLAQELAAKDMTMLPRIEAEASVNYSGNWPPSPAVLSQLADKNGYDYVAIGSLTKLGKQLSLDIAVFDTLTPSALHTSFRESPLDDELDLLINDVITEIITYTNRNFVVASIAPAGNVRIDSGAVLRKINTKPGDFYNTATLRHDLKAVYAMGYFDDVAIDVTDTPNGKAVIFQVKEKPLISMVSFSGTDEIAEADVQEAANIQPNSIINPAKINEAVQRIKGLYKSKGYFATQVTANLSYPSPESVDVDFRIKEGEKVSVSQITFEGNTTFDDDDLRGVVETGTWNLLSWLTESGVLKMDVLYQDADRLKSYYYNHGFIEAKVGEPQVVEQEDSLHITFPIEEGPRYRVGTVEIEGDLIENKDILISMLAIRKEAFLNWQVLREDSMKLTDLYAENGYAFAEARPLTQKSDTGARMDIMFKINKGSLVYFNRVEIQGNTRTRDNVIRRDLTVEEGGVFDSRAIQSSTQKLQRLGFFEEVTVTPQPTMNEDQMNVLVDIKEKSTGQFSIGAGYSSSESVMFMGEISENNLLGTGNRLTLNANISGLTTRFNLSYTNPRFLDSNVSAGLDVFNWRREYDAYTKDSYGGGVRFGNPFVEKWYIYYGYTLDNTHLTDVATYASQAIRDSMDINLTSSVNVRLLRDTRNHQFTPSRGSENTFSVRHAGGFLGGDAQFTKVEGSSSWYFPLLWKTVFHIKGSIGDAYADDDKKLPVYERYYLGGMNSIRGFPSASISPVDPITDEKIGGDKMWFSNIALQFPLLEGAGLFGEVFTDIGNVYAVGQSWDFSDNKQTVGVGFLWMSPMGPIRMAWGYNTDKQPDEDQSNWDFTMGGAF